MFSSLTNIFIICVHQCLSVVYYVFSVKSLYAFQNTELVLFKCADLFRLQFYFNGHNWMDSQLKAKEIQFEIVDDAFAYISDFEKANELAKSLAVEQLFQRLNALGLLILSAGL